MNKKTKIQSLINAIREQAEELADDSNTDSMSAEEIVVTATEMILNTPVTSIEYSQPIGIVDRQKVSFMLDEDIAFELFPEEEEYWEEQW
jgi:hypothetical protein